MDSATHDNPDAIRSALVQQLYSLVRWAETIRRMAKRGVDTLVESGPGKVLGGLNRRIEKGTNAMPVFDTVSLGEVLAVAGE